MDSRQQHDSVGGERFVRGPADVARVKQASRDQDAADLASGRKSREQLRVENSAFSFPHVRVRIGSAYHVR